MNVHYIVLFPGSSQATAAYVFMYIMQQKLGREEPGNVGSN